MRSDDIVGVLPDADHDLRLLQRVEDLLLQAFVFVASLRDHCLLADQCQALALRRLHIDLAQQQHHLLRPRLLTSLLATI